MKLTNKRNKNWTEDTNDSNRSLKPPHTTTWWKQKAKHCFWESRSKHPRGTHRDEERGTWVLRSEEERPGPGTVNSHDLLCFNCKIIRQASKRTWHLAPKGGVCVKERFVWKTYCWCQHTLNYTSDSLESWAYKAERSVGFGAAPQKSFWWKKNKGNCTFSACIINHYNHLLYTALLNIPPGTKGVNILLKNSVTDCKISFQIKRRRWRNAAENKQFIFTTHSRSLLELCQGLRGFQPNSCIKRKLHPQHAPRGTPLSEVSCTAV